MLACAGANLQLKLPPCLFRPNRILPLPSFLSDFLKGLCIQPAVSGKIFREGSAQAASSLRRSSSEPLLPPLPSPPLLPSTVPYRLLPILSHHFFILFYPPSPSLSFFPSNGATSSLLLNLLSPPFDLSPLPPHPLPLHLHFHLHLHIFPAH